MKFLKPFLLWLAIGLPGNADSDPLASYRWNSRVIVLSASDRTDGALAAQKRLLAEDSSGLAERDVVILEILGQARQTARKDLRLSGGFRFVLVGKDGGVKFRSDQPVTLTELYGVIDAMPMRRQEMRGLK
jgi:hypothetical protein